MRGMLSRRSIWDPLGGCPEARPEVCPEVCPETFLFDSLLKSEFCMSGFVSGHPLCCTVLATTPVTTLGSFPVTTPGSFPVTTPGSFPVTTPGVLSGHNTGVLSGHNTGVLSGHTTGGPFRSQYCGWFPVTTLVSQSLIPMSNRDAHWGAC